MFITSLLLASSLASLCPSIGSLASTVMEARQKSIPMSSVLKAVENSDASEEVKELGRQMVVEAYSTGLYNTDIYKNLTIKEFSNKYESACYRVAYRK